MLTAPLPQPAGPLSGALIAQLSGRVQDLTRLRPDGTDPMGRDLQLALYVAYELSYRGFADVAADWEWDVDLIGLRLRLERHFLEYLRRCVGDIDGVSAQAEMRRLAGEPPDDPVHHSPDGGPSHFLRSVGTWEQLREYFVHRSLYHLKEADPQSWVIPRLTGAAKAAYVAVQYDEYGAGRATHMHQQLFAELMTAAGLDAGYLSYLDAVPAESLAVVNISSMFGLHRDLRGAAVGHFAATEITSPPGSRRLVQALQRLGAPEPCQLFYREHVEADAVHEQVVVNDVVGDLLRADPDLNNDIVFGVRARDIVEDRLAEHMMKCWADGESSLLG
ncbi:iron-containing redox enzyme family protein [Mycobacterium sp. C31M]